MVAFQVEQENILTENNITGAYSIMLVYRHLLTSWYKYQIITVAFILLLQHVIVVGVIYGKRQEVELI